jgi:exodeoxyribonuclease VII large subunit
MPELPVLTVSQLTRQLKELVETGFPLVSAVGEISGCTRAGSGHVYLTLKDASAQIRAVIWRGVAQRIRFDLRDGLEVVVAGPLEVYEARGTYQLVVERIWPQGIGALELAFRQMQAKLAAEGLFDARRKRPLPRFPRRIALVTSPTGAAVRDLLQVLVRRWPAVDVVIVPVPVQGAGAAEKIAAGLRTAGRLPGVEVVITGRGGGSLEDLWAFNEEVVARAIAACPVPVVSAVGHEIDVTIADLVSDRRALTPSEAAELVVPELRDVLDELEAHRTRLGAGLRSLLSGAQDRLRGIASRPVFVRPFGRVHESARALDDLAERLRRAVRARNETGRRDVSGAAAALEALSPLRVLDRGYTITRLAEGGTVLRSVRDVDAGRTIETVFRDGRVTSTVASLSADPVRDATTLGETPGR